MVGLRRRRTTLSAAGATLFGALAFLPLTPLASAGGQTVSISVLPPVSQAGSTPALASAALTVVAAQVSPAIPGRLVVLSLKAGRGWTRVAETTLTDDGLAEFSVPTLVSGKPATYRATAAAYQAYPAITTAPVLSTQWGPPDFGDEFSGASLSATWSHRGGDYNPAALRTCSKGSPAAVQVADGVVRLSVMADLERTSECTAYRMDGSVLGQFRYRLNGHISTHGMADLTYGVAAARIKFHQSRGQHGSFWFQPATPVPGATAAAEGGAEIDVVEWFGDGGPNSGLSGSVYYPTTSGRAKAGGWIADPGRYLADLSDSWWSGYHVFSVEWTPQAYVFRIDGRETWRTSEGVSGRPEFPILSLLSSDYELPHLGGEDRLPQHMYVDWVQFWRS